MDSYPEIARLHLINSRHRAGLIVSSLVLGIITITGSVGADKAPEPVDITDIDLEAELFDRRRMTLDRASRAGRFAVDGCIGVSADNSKDCAVVEAEPIPEPAPEPEPVPPPPAPEPEPVPQQVFPPIEFGIWDGLAECESSGNWHINTGNGYYGGLQFTLQSWQAVGGTGMPHEASREEQIHRGQRLQAIQGWGAWPACSEKLDLR